MSGVPSADSAPGYGTLLRRRFPALAWVGRVDDAIYAVERTVVTMSMLVMSAVVCINVLFQFMARQRAIVDRLGDGASAIELWPAVAVAAAIALLARGVWRQSPACRDNPPAVAVLTVVTVVAFAGLCGALIVLESNVVMALTVLIAGAWVALAEYDRPRPLGEPAFGRASRARVAVVIAFTVAAAVACLQIVPERYSWTTKLALFLLLWTAFIGASMATHEGRHLTIDAARKALPVKLLPYYEALSHLVAALFTAAFAWLAFLYLDVRLDESAAPGEIPDWLKVLAIPVSLVLVTARFAGRSISALLAGVLGLTADAAEEGQQ